MEPPIEEIQEARTIGTFSEIPWLIKILAVMFLLLLMGIVVSLFYVSESTPPPKKLTSEEVRRASHLQEMQIQQ
jgi:hypothetical protein